MVAKPGKQDPEQGYVRAYPTPIFSPSDPLICQSIQLRPDLWAVLFNELNNLGEGWSWRQDDITHATPAEVAKEFQDAIDRAVFSGCTMLGEVKWIGTAIPEWCLLCDGTEYDADDYPDLFAVIDDAYKTSPVTFVVPDLLFRFPRGAIVPGGAGGADTVILTTTELPAHGHGTHDHGVLNPRIVDVGTNPPAFIYAQSDLGLPGNTDAASVPSAGDGEAFSITNPYHDLIPVFVAKHPGAV